MITKSLSAAVTKHTASPVTAPRAGLKPATQQRIEAAVIAAFSKQEFHRVNLVDIAASANVSLQTIYKYYGSKDALLFVTLGTCLRQLEARMADHLKGISDCKARLRKVFWLTLEFIETQPDVIQVMMSSVYLGTWHQQDSFRNPELFGTFIKVLGEGRTRGILNDEVDEKILLDFIQGLVFRLGHMYIHRGRSQSLTAQFDALFNMLWRAISKPTITE